MGEMREYRKLDIAHEYLEVAAELFLAARFFPALHLAGAAEELYGAVIQAQISADAQKPLLGGKIRIRTVFTKPFMEDLVSAIQRGQEKRGAPVMPADEIKGTLRRAKNSAKHAMRGNAFNLTMAVDAEREAMAMIVLATFNCERLGFTPRRNVRIVKARFLGQDEQRAADEFDW